MFCQGEPFKAIWLCTTQMGTENKRFTQRFCLAVPLPGDGTYGFDFSSFFPNCLSTFSRLIFHYLAIRNKEDTNHKAQSIGLLLRACSSEDPFWAGLRSEAGGGEKLTPQRRTGM